jgi:hypothetical protein
VNKLTSKPSPSLIFGFTDLKALRLKPKSNSLSLIEGKYAKGDAAFFVDVSIKTEV